MISHRHRCILVHIPKTGGSSIEDILWTAEERTKENLYRGLVDTYSNKYQTGGLQHLLAKQVREEVGTEVFQSYFKFGFVRNPWDRAVSNYLFAKRSRHILDFLELPYRVSFNQFLYATCKKDHVQWAPQKPFLFDEEGVQLVDFIGRFEDFENQVRQALKVIHVEPKVIPHSIKSKRGPYPFYYNARTKGLIAERYAEDIEFFGYKFEDSRKALWPWSRWITKFKSTFG